MRALQVRWSTSSWQPEAPGGALRDAALVLVFGSRALLDDGRILNDVRAAYPDAIITGCSTAGEIFGDAVLDDSVVVTAVRFDDTRCAPALVTLAEVADSVTAGARLAAQLPDHQRLRHVLVFSDGLHVNGSELVQGLTQSLLPHTAVTGGLSADGPRFEQTTVVAAGHATHGVVVAVGLYGERLHVGYGSLGGWDAFGPVRTVTRSAGNVLYELDGQSALALYKKYLGEQACDLPASGLLFPLRIRVDGAERGVVRTILSVSDADDSMTFAGDIPEGASAQLMRANFDRLVDGAIGAARVSAGAINGPVELALLISCVGRKMVLQQRIEEEIEGVREVVGRAAIMAGFYSYGEISPFTPTARCELHNQTMTVTTFAER